MYRHRFHDIVLVEKAAKAYVKSAECEEHDGVAADAYIEAGNCMKKVNLSEGVKLVQQGINTFRSSCDLRSVLFSLSRLIV